MSIATSLPWVPKLLTCLIIFGATISLKSQSNPFVGRWTASEPDNGVLITLTIGETSSLVFPGHRQDGRTEALNLAVRNLMTSEQVATFTVDLPNNEGPMDLEFRKGTASDMGTLRVTRVDGQAADNDIPSWILGRAR